MGPGNSRFLIITAMLGQNLNNLHTFSNAYAWAKIFLHLIEFDLDELSINFVPVIDNSA